METDSAIQINKEKAATLITQKSYSRKGGRNTSVFSEALTGSLVEKFSARKRGLSTSRANESLGETLKDNSITPFEHIGLNSTTNVTANSNATNNSLTNTAEFLQEENITSTFNETTASETDTNRQFANVASATTVDGNESFSSNYNVTMSDYISTSARFTNETAPSKITLITGLSLLLLVAAGFILFALGFAVFLWLVSAGLPLLDQEAKNIKAMRNRQKNLRDKAEATPLLDNRQEVQPIPKDKSSSKKQEKRGRAQEPQRSPKRSLPENAVPPHRKPIDSEPEQLLKVSKGSKELGPNKQVKTAAKVDDKKSNKADSPATLNDVVSTQRDENDDSEVATNVDKKLTLSRKGSSRKARSEKASSPMEAKEIRVSKKDSRTPRSTRGGEAQNIPTTPVKMERVLHKLDEH